jgi:predicted transcriptional regulator of viral defense system
MRREDIDSGKLVDYALKINVGAVIRRLGFLLELFEMEASRELERLRERLTMTYSILDPIMPAEGKFLARWRLKLNVSPEEIEAVVRA